MNGACTKRVPRSALSETVDLDGAESETSLTIVYNYNYTSDIEFALQVIATGFIEEVVYGELLKRQSIVPRERGKG